MANKYWETESPQIFQSEKNELRVFTAAGKIQTYTRVKNSSTGVSKGVTIDLASMDVEQLDYLKATLTAAIDAQIAELAEPAK